VTEIEVQNVLRRLLENYVLDIRELISGDPARKQRNSDIVKVDTFDEAGIATKDKGLVCCFADGSQFMIEIVKDEICS